MSDLYTELLVKKKKTPKDSLIKYGLIVLTVLFALAGLLIHPYLWAGLIVFAILDYFIIPKTNLEYEYLFVNGEMDIDVIMSQSKRKRVFSFQVSDIDLMAPVNSHRMDYYNNNQKMKVYDFSSGYEDHKCFAAIMRHDNDTCRVLLEPDDTLAQGMRNYAPSKIYLD